MLYTVALAVLRWSKGSRRWLVGVVADVRLPGEEPESIWDRRVACGGRGRCELWPAGFLDRGSAGCGGAGGAGEGKGSHLQQRLQVPYEEGNSEPRSGEPQEGGARVRPSYSAWDPRRVRHAAGGWIGGRRRGGGIIARWRLAGCEGSTIDG